MKTIILLFAILLIAISSINGNDLKVKDLIKKDECARKTQNGDYLSVHYVGKFDNGTQFDTSIGKKPYKFSLGSGQVYFF
jgi:FKBP-type peptidyl-prolyl cis-trans isomerase